MSISGISAALAAFVSNLQNPGDSICVCGDLGDPFCPECSPRCACTECSCNQAKPFDGGEVCNACRVNVHSDFSPYDWTAVADLVDSPDFSVDDRQFPFGVPA